MQFHIPDMSCGGCARGVAKAVEAVDPDAQVTTDLANRRVEVRSARPAAVIAAALAEAGYPTAEAPA